jgi:hypothetical protein
MMISYPGEKGGGEEIGVEAEQKGFPARVWGIGGEGCAVTAQPNIRRL